MMYDNKNTGKLSRTEAKPWIEKWCLDDEGNKLSKEMVDLYFDEISGKTEQITKDQLTSFLKT